VVSVREEFGEAIPRYPETNLEGDYQRWNAATATLAAGLLPAGFGISRSSIDSGLRAVDWPGRWQRIDLGGRLAILDASHNVEGAGVLDANLARLHVETGRSPVAIVGTLGSTRALPLLEVLCRHCRELRLVVPQQARASTFAELESLIPGTFRGQAFRSTVEELFPAPGVCTAGTPDDVILVTGSIYLLGEVLARLEPQRGLGEGRLQDF
jgi:dihydrofolate synthase/folylpolyglutamate synthase